MNKRKNEDDTSRYLNKKAKTKPFKQASSGSYSLSFDSDTESSSDDGSSYSSYDDLTSTTTQTIDLNKSPSENTSTREANKDELERIILMHPSEVTLLCQYNQFCKDNKFVIHSHILINRFGRFIARESDSFIEDVWDFTTQQTTLFDVNYSDVHNGKIFQEVYLSNKTSSNIKRFIDILFDSCILNREQIASTQKRNIELYSVVFTGNISKEHRLRRLNKTFPKTYRPSYEISIIDADKTSVLEWRRNSKNGLIEEIVRDKPIEKILTKYFTLISNFQTAKTTQAKIENKLERPLSYEEYLYLVNKKWIKSTYMSFIAFGTVAAIDRATYIAKIGAEAVRRVL